MNMDEGEPADSGRVGAIFFSHALFSVLRCSFCCVVFFSAYMLSHLARQLVAPGTYMDEQTDEHRHIQMVDRLQPVSACGVASWC